MLTSRTRMSVFKMEGASPDSPPRQKVSAPQWRSALCVTGNTASCWCRGDFNLLLLIGNHSWSFLLIISLLFHGHWGYLFIFPCELNQTQLFQTAFILIYYLKVTFKNPEKSTSCFANIFQIFTQLIFDLSLTLRTMNCSQWTWTQTQTRSAWQSKLT